MSNHIRLDACCNDNWRGESAPPVAILNPETTLHDRIAYCWGLGAQIEELSMLLLDTPADSAQSRIGTLLKHNIDPLMAVLHELGCSTLPNKFGGAK
ncbi:hypothetical protein LHU53_12095 [Rhodoferax sp. U2-2l]|uniref:hypothetical protein n=1 Tax=Rhodoferax sp. U2-2l TaxID=2884000 RepID=UPI001D0B2581|nr:hypothetical protein [Rhodoferax sp. U2-2l]MCB8747646.1 hypothetical protein [Rhodoferax sp. U2-2l]